MTTKRFEGTGGKVTKLICARVDEKFKEIPGSEFEIPADMVLLAMGFVSPVQDDVVAEAGLELDGRRQRQSRRQGLRNQPRESVRRRRYPARSKPCRLGHS